MVELARQRGAALVMSRSSLPNVSCAAQDVAKVKDTGEGDGDPGVHRVVFDGDDAGVRHEDRGAQILRAPSCRTRSAHTPRPRPVAARDERQERGPQPRTVRQSTPAPLPRSCSGSSWHRCPGWSCTRPLKPEAQRLAGSGLLDDLDLEFARRAMRPIAPLPRQTPGVLKSDVVHRPADHGTVPPMVPAPVTQWSVG